MLSPKLPKALAALKTVLAEPKTIGMAPYTIKYVGGKETLSVQMNQLDQRDPELTEQFKEDLIALPNNKGARYKTFAEALQILDQFIAEYPAFKIEEFLLVDAKGMKIPPAAVYGKQTSIFAP